jgi:hypothetical protein
MVGGLGLALHSIFSSPSQPVVTLLLLLLLLLLSNPP